MILKIGDKVIKAREYSPSEYCHFGGSEYYLPLGTKGEITGTGIGNRLIVRFENGKHWTVHPTELDKQNKTWKEMFEDKRK